jgi:hypothetical protein
VKIGHPVQKKHSLTHSLTHTHTLSLSLSTSTLNILSLTLNQKRGKERKKNIERGRGTHCCTLTLKRKSGFSHLGTCPSVLRILLQQQYQLQILFTISQLLINLPAVTTVSGHLQHRCTFNMSTEQNMSDRLLRTGQHVTLSFNKTRLSQVLHYRLNGNVYKM